MNIANLRNWGTNNLIKELRKYADPFALHNMGFWRKDWDWLFAAARCLHTACYKPTQLIGDVQNKLIQIDLCKRKIRSFSYFFKNDAVLFWRPEISSSLSENNWIDVEEEFCLICSLSCGWRRRNSEWSYRFKTLFPQMVILFFPRCCLVI